MTRRAVISLLPALCLALCAVLVAFVPPACWAVPSDDGKVGSDLDIGTLSDRYGLLNNLGNSLTEEESVVIETRVGVLTSVNRALDDSNVRFTGEIVGDVVNAGAGHKWANASGAANTVISVFMTDEQAQLVESVGGYHTTGTSLMMTGVYHVACPEHQGELDVHTTSVEVVAKGKPIKHPLKHRRMHAAFVFCTLALFILGGFFAARSYLRKREDD